MTIEDGHFRTDGKTIEPCCQEMKGTICLLGVDHCPWCGAKLEFINILRVKE